MRVDALWLELKCGHSLKDPGFESGRMREQVCSVYSCRRKLRQPWLSWAQKREEVVTVCLDFQAEAKSVKLI